FEPGLDSIHGVVAQFAVALAWRLTSTWPSLAGLVIGAKGFTAPGFLKVILLPVARPAGGGWGSCGQRRIRHDPRPSPQARHSRPRRQDRCTLHHRSPAHPPRIERT